MCDIYKIWVIFIKNITYLNHFMIGGKFFLKKKSRMNSSADKFIYTRNQISWDENYFLLNYSISLCSQVILLFLLYNVFLIFSLVCYLSSLLNSYFKNSVYYSKLLLNLLGFIICNLEGTSVSLWKLDLSFHYMFRACLSIAHFSFLSFFHYFAIPVWFCFLTASPVAVFLPVFLPLV